VDYGCSLIWFICLVVVRRRLRIYNGLWCDCYCPYGLLYYFSSVRLCSVVFFYLGFFMLVCFHGVVFYYVWYPGC